MEHLATLHGESHKNTNWTFFLPDSTRLLSYAIKEHSLVIRLVEDFTS